MLLTTFQGKAYSQEDQSHVIKEVARPDHVIIEIGEFEDPSPPEEKAEAKDAQTTKDSAPPQESTGFCSRVGQFLKSAQYLYPAVMLCAAPTVLSAVLPVEVVEGLYWTGAAAINITNAWVIGEALASFKAWSDSRSLHEKPLSPDLPKNLSAIIPAYLPNETDVLPDTIRSVASLKLPPEGTLKIVVVHNGGNPEQRTKLKKEVAEIQSYLNKQNLPILIEEHNVESSHSKAENVNRALEILGGSETPPDVCALYDADHRPDQNAYNYALQTLQEEEADVVQGRCAIDRGSKFIAAEFDALYGVNHAGGGQLRDFAFFGGSNGYWKYPLLNEIKMDPTMLTEDIDSSLRALDKGAKVVFDPLVLSFEEAPPSFQSLVKQRLRWTQGWSQVSLRNLKLLGHKDLTAYKKAMIFLLLHWRELYYYLAPYTFPAAISYMVRTGSGPCMPLVAASALQMIIPPAVSLLARYHVGDKRHPDLDAKAYAQYSAISPVYEQFKNILTVWGHVRNMLGITKWEVTNRGPAKDNSKGDHMKDTKQGEHK